MKLIVDKKGDLDIIMQVIEDKVIDNTNVCTVVKQENERYIEYTIKIHKKHG